MSFLLISLFVFHVSYAIQPTPEIIDKRLKELRIDYNNQNKTIDDAISTVKNLYEDSKSINYNDGIRQSGIMLEIFYNNKGDFGRAIKISDEIETLVKNSDHDYVNNQKYYVTRASSYSQLGFLSRSYDEYQKAIKMAEKIPDKDQKYTQLALTHLGLSNYYAITSSPSSKQKFFHLLKALEAGESVSKNGSLAKDGTRNEMIINLNYFLGNGYMNLEKPDMVQAKKYFMQAQEVYESSATKMATESEVKFLSCLCRFYYNDKNFDKAIEIGQNALKIGKKGASQEDIKNIYQSLFESYLSVGNKNESQKYRDLYFNLNDSINKNLKANINQSAEKMISKKEKEGKKNVIQIIYITCGIITLLGIITFALWKRNNQKLHKNYQKIISHLEQDKNQAFYEENTPKQKVEKESYISIIADDTQKQILLKLNSFEKSLDFLQKDITLTTLATYCNTNPKYLSEIIKENKNKTFSAYINGLKINYITRKIFKKPLYREYKISYLAEECGYSSSQVFVIAFKKETGVTPSYFINNVKKDSNKI